MITKLTIFLGCFVRVKKKKTGPFAKTKEAEYTETKTTGPIELEQTMQKKKTVVNGWCEGALPSRDKAILFSILAKFVQHCKEFQNFIC